MVFSFLINTRNIGWKFASLINASCVEWRLHFVLAGPNYEYFVLKKYRILNLAAQTVMDLCAMSI